MFLLFLNDFESCLLLRLLQNHFAISRHLLSNIEADCFRGIDQIVTLVEAELFGFLAKLSVARVLLLHLLQAK